MKNPCTEVQLQNVFIPGDNGLAGLKNDLGLIQKFVNSIESKDLYTKGHSHHVQVVADAIFDSLPTLYKDTIHKETLSQAALLHDVGKIVTPDHILNKEGLLDEKEWDIMRRHPAAGKNFLDNAGFAEIGDWILYHHERMDGRGYYGLQGTSIPLESRIIAVADAFSALRTYRIYRPAKSLEETIRIMRASTGTQLDSELVACFFSVDADVLAALECTCEICRQRRNTLEAMPSG
jgi:HD-GYP domain-containing protein (c-di-GMP phosphodiesterase class II)